MIQRRFNGVPNIKISREDMDDLYSGDPEREARARANVNERQWRMIQEYEYHRKNYQWGDDEEMDRLMADGKDEEIEKRKAMMLAAERKAEREMREARIKAELERERIEEEKRQYEIKKGLALEKAKAIKAKLTPAALIGRL